MSVNEVGKKDPSAMSMQTGLEQHRLSWGPFALAGAVETHKCVVSFYTETAAMVRFLPACCSAEDCMQEMGLLPALLQVVPRWRHAGFSWLTQCLMPGHCYRSTPGLQWLPSLFCPVSSASVWNALSVQWRRWNSLCSLGVSTDPAFTDEFFQYLAL